MNPQFPLYIVSKGRHKTRFNTLSVQVSLVAIRVDQV